MPDPRSIEDIIARLRKYREGQLSMIRLNEASVDTLLTEIDAQKAEIERLREETTTQREVLEAAVRAGADVIEERDRLRAELAAQPSAAASLPSAAQIADIIAADCPIACQENENCICYRHASSILTLLRSRLIDAEAIRAEEREACAKVADRVAADARDRPHVGDSPALAADTIAWAIRARTPGATP